MPQLSVIILSYAIDDEIYQTNCRCLESLFESEDWERGSLEVLLIESNKKTAYQYDNRVTVIIPQEAFNFHRFLNIGLARSTGNFVAFCNNDIVFTHGWFSAILDVKRNNPKFKCFSPLDRTYSQMGENSLPSSLPYYIGWENKKYFAAWCFVWERDVFDVIGSFDETFDFYSADDDELMTLRYYAIPNVVVTKSEVKHLSQVVTNKVGTSKYRVTNKEKYPLTQNEISRGLSWLWDDVRFYVAYKRMYKKWGNERMRGRIDRLLEKYPKVNIPFITKILYNRNIIQLLCKLTGIKQ